MELKLKLLNGPNAGQTLSVAGPKFVVGRAEGCQLRAKSSSISDRHCEFEITLGGATLRDLGSETGTFVNGEKLTSGRALETGDKLKIGPLEFEVAIKLGLASKKKPKVTGAAEAAARLAAGRPEDIDIDELLDESLEDKSSLSPYAGFLSDEEKAALGILDDGSGTVPPTPSKPTAPPPPSDVSDPRKAAIDSLSKHLKRR